MTVKRFLCVLLVVSLLVVPVSAEYDSYYELSPVVSSPELFSFGVTKAAVSDSGISTMNLTTGESQQLADIRNALVAGYTNATSSSILGLIRSIKTNTDGYASYLQTISNALTSNSQSSILGYLYDISYNTDTLRTFVSEIAPFANRQLESINNALTNTTDGVKPVASIMASRLASIVSYTNATQDILSRINKSFTFDTATTSAFIAANGSPTYSNTKGPVTIPYMINQMGFQLGYDIALKDTGDRTLYSRIKQLQQVLASDDDKALANSQKENRQEIEDTFLSGSSGGTSLGKSDFGALSDIGDTVKETISLNGQSSVSDFTDGLAGADEAGQGWFSESTRFALDTVSSSASYGLRDDPYNMSGWQDRYAWLEGEE